MLSTLLFAAALVLTLVAAALHDRAGRWRRRPLRPLVHLLGPAAAAASLAVAPSWAIIEKFLTALVLPVGALWLATFALIWWLLLRQRRRQAAVALLLWCAASVAGNVWVGQAMLACSRRAMRRSPPARGSTPSSSWAGAATSLDGSLKQITDAVRKHRELGAIKLFIAGHTDTVGATGYNLKLSQKRAQSIAGWFRSHGLRVPIFYEGFGEQALLVATPDETDEGRNRRVDYILSVEEPALKSATFHAAWKRSQ
jgi:hypothetical protein